MQVQRSELVESLQIVAGADRLTSRAGTALLVGLSRPGRADGGAFAGPGLRARGGSGSSARGRRRRAPLCLTHVTPVTRRSRVGASTCPPGR
jgi:hypothetical protein